MDQAKVKVLLKRLFAVADDDASADGEIDNAMAAAANLMSLYQIERDDVFEDEDGVNVTKVSYGQDRRYSLYTSLCAWESILCKFIVEFVPGVGYYVTRGSLRRNNAGMTKGGKATMITFYGADSDVTFAGEIFDEVVYFIRAAARLRYGTALARGAAASYAEGFSRALLEANQKQTQQLEEQSASDSTSLVVVNRGLAIREGGRNWLSKEHDIKLRKGPGARSQSNRSAQAYQQGKTDGRTYKPTSTKKAGLLTRN